LRNDDNEKTKERKILGRDMMRIELLSKNWTGDLGTF